MKKLEKLKLNQLSKAEMEKREMNHLKGGDCCGCGCHYTGSGGSSAYHNLNANQANGYHSYGGDIGCSYKPGPGYDYTC
jgi:natural product precursor